MELKEHPVATQTPVYCVNHPNTETLLRCNRCGRPVCLKCVERTPVGYRCKQCLNVQQSGYYTATYADYVIALVVGLAVSVAGGVIASLIGFFLFEIFYAPFAGGVIAEVIRQSVRKHRGRYLWLVGCAAVILGGIFGAGLFPLLASGGGIGLLRLLENPLALPFFVGRALFNIGFLIYIVLAVGTVYARLR